MERKLTIDDLNNMKPGDEILAVTLMIDSVYAFTGKHRDGKYNIISNGKKCRSLGYKKGVGIQYVFAEDEGCTGDETEWHYSFVGLGSLDFDDTNAQETIDGFNLRLIDESHPKFDKQLQKTGKMMGKMFSGFESILGNPFNEGEEKEITKPGKKPLMDDEQQSSMFDLFKELQDEFGNESEDELNQAHKKNENEDLIRQMFGNVKPKKSKKK